ncbi:MAG: 1-phosphofructokinase family hexose kinase [Solobacterium sp.]|nr:1-phosphofructokinase family hexose kinase [Solobacterium sp.]
MICTCTLNPSLDYYMEFEKNVESGHPNRSNLEYYEAGGKGINISSVLSNLQIPSRAYGFLGGFTREFYIMLLQKYEFIQPNFTIIDGHTRINVKMHDKQETELNAAGPYITNTDMKNLSDKVGRLTDGDYFALAGMCPNYLEDEVVTMLKKAIGEGVKVILDTNADIVRYLVNSKPFLVRMSSAELSEYAKKNLASDEDIIEAAKKLHEEGAEHVIILLDNRSKAILVCDEGVYEGEILHDNKAVNTVGTGDSLTAGFIMNYARSNDPIDSFKFAVCCGSATAYSKGMAKKEKIEAFYQDAEVKKLA